MGQASTDTVGFVVAIVLLAIITLAGVWDLYALFSPYGHTATVSHHIHLWSRQFPVGVFLFGLITGHLLWQTYTPPHEVNAK